MKRKKNCHISNVSHISFFVMETKQNSTYRDSNKKKRTKIKNSLIYIDKKLFKSKRK